MPIKFNLSIIFIMVSIQVSASFIYVPFEQLVAEADYIVMGEIIDKQYQKKASVMNRYASNPVTGLREVVESSQYMTMFTDYDLRIHEVIKGELNWGSIIKIDEMGGCDEDEGVCSSLSTGYAYSVGSQVLIFLKKRAGRDFFYSTEGGLTAYLVTDNGRIYQFPEELEKISSQNFSDDNEGKPKTTDELIKLVKTQAAQAKYGL